MHRAILALAGVLAAAPLTLPHPAAAQSVRLEYGMPLGSFTAHPAGQRIAVPSTAHRAGKQAARPTGPADRRKRDVAAAPAAERPAPAAPQSTVRADAADAAAIPTHRASNEPQKVETKTEADAPTNVASGENRTCRKFIATAGTTIEVPCEPASN